MLKPTGINIVLWLYESPPGKHAQAVMRELGIEYQRAEPQSLGDCWFFISVTESTIPDPLPDYLTVRRLTIEQYNAEVEYLKRHQTKS